MIWILFVAILLLAYANGSNDNFKGVATLYGGGAATFRGALAWATQSRGPRRNVLIGQKGT